MSACFSKSRKSYWKKKLADHRQVGLQQAWKGVSRFKRNYYLFSILLLGCLISSFAKIIGMPSLKVYRGMVHVSDLRLDVMVVNISYRLLSSKSSPPSCSLQPIYMYQIPGQLWFQPFRKPISQLQGDFKLERRSLFVEKKK